MIVRVPTARLEIALLAATPQGQTVLLQAGHQLMAERPDETLAALLEFLRPPRAAGVPA